jgi:hypothetical protein
MMLSLYCTTIGMPPLRHHDAYYLQMTLQFGYSATSLYHGGHYNAALLDCNRAITLQPTYDKALYAHPFNSPSICVLKFQTVDVDVVVVRPMLH